MLIPCNGNWCIVSQISNGYYPWISIITIISIHQTIHYYSLVFPLISHQTIPSNYPLIYDGVFFLPLLRATLFDEPISNQLPHEMNVAVPGIPPVPLLFVCGFPGFGHWWLPNLHDSSFSKTSSTHMFKSKSFDLKLGADRNLEILELPNKKKKNMKDM